MFNISGLVFEAPRVSETSKILNELVTRNLELLLGSISTPRLKKGIVISRDINEHTHLL
jgi:hypothetical protein